MRYYHRHSFFPLVIILLTLLLGTFIFLTVSREKSVGVQETLVLVDADAYRAELVNLLTTFETDIQAAPDNAAKLLVAESAFADLVALRVPPADKQLHLTLALALTNIQTTLKSADADIGDELLQIRTIKDNL